MATLTDFRGEFPELAAQDDAAVEQAIKSAQAIHSLRPLATLYCAAHLLVADDGVTQPDGGHGEVTGESVGQLSSSYMAQAERGRESFFTTTSYGRRFLVLEQRSAYPVSIRVY